MTEDKINRILKKSIWVYFLLLFFEGALRKWVLPQLATPLLIVRDPIAIFILVQSIRYKVWKPNSWVLIAWLITIIGMITTFLLGHGNILVTIYGIRIMILHFPLIFIFGKVLTLKDIELMGKVLLWITIGMTILVALQFFSPQSAFVNRGIAGEEGSGFSGAAGFYRVPGTFSFTNGLSLFYGLAGCFIFYFLIRKKKIVDVPRYLILASLIALIVAIPLSISRMVLFQFLITAIFVLVISSKNPKIFLRILISSVVLFVFFLILQNFHFFQTATMAFSTGLDTAQRIEGGTEGILLDRVLGGFIEPFTKSNSVFFGKGLGIGTNVGARLLTGERMFLISEDEWGRIIEERGFVFGIAIILIRFFLTIKMLVFSWYNLSSENILPWILLSFVALKLLNGQLGQPTTLGFVVIAAGFLISSFNYDQKNKLVN